MSNKDRAEAIIKDILVNHLPRVQEGLEKGYVDENQILVMYDHAVRSRILTEQSEPDVVMKACEHPKHLEKHWPASGETTCGKCGALLRA